MRYRYGSTILRSSGSAKGHKSGPLAHVSEVDWEKCLEACMNEQHLQVDEDYGKIIAPKANSL
jgi:hypothetical protein